MLALVPGAAPLLALALLFASAPGAAEPDPSPPGAAAPESPGGEPRPDAQPAAPPPEGAPDPSTRWLNEVRAQRQAWEERRKANRDAFEARRRVVDPRGSAHHEAWEEEVERRREARRQHREQERELFRSLGPSEPLALWPETTDPEGRYATITPPAPGHPPGDRVTAEGVSPAPGEPAGPGTIYPPGVPPRAPYSPQDWDNLWYYRGY